MSSRSCSLSNYNPNPMKPLREHYTQPTDQGDMLNVFDYIEALEKHIEELNVDKLLDDFHEWIELYEWGFCPVFFLMGK